MRTSLCIWALVFPAATAGQPTSPALQEILDAEQAFIEQARVENTRSAFLDYLSDDVVTNGPNGPTVGKERINSQPANDGWLSWQVIYGDAAGSGDFGYTTGPWEYRTNKKDEDAVAFGEFHSIWKKQSDGIWRNIVDIGIQHGPPTQEIALTTTSMPLGKVGVNPNQKNALTLFLANENAFVASFDKRGNFSYDTHASAEIRYARDGRQPIVSDLEKNEFLRSESPYAHYVPIDGGIAVSGDLGYIYGTAASKENDRKQATYLRIWKKEQQGEWKIVLDVLAVGQ